MTQRWFCARTKPRQEQVAISNLERQGFAVYFPKISIERARHGRIAVHREPLFPSYLLIHFTLADDTWRTINNTRGVSGLLSFAENGRPSPMPIGEVEAIKTRETQGLLFVSEVKRIHRGDKVRLKIGPAADAIGKVIFTRGERVQLLLNLLGRQTLVKAPLHVVEPVAQRGRC